jgi:hypothetical protein
MSTLPPASPPPPSTEANPLPWEDRVRRGFMQSLLETIGLFVSRPSEAWTRAKETGDVASPLLFGVLICWFSTVVRLLIFRWVAIPFALPGRFGRFAMMRPFGGAGFLFWVVLAPIFIAVGVFIGAAILHLCCMIVGGLSESRSGFEGSLRTVCYSEVSSLASIVPVVGGIAAIVWWIVLAIMGVQRMHRTTQGKAAAAVLIPVIVCCGAAILIALMAGAAFMMRRGT